MSHAEYLKTAKPHLVVDLTLYPTEAGGKSLPTRLGWGSLCTIQSEEGSGWVGYDGWPLLIDGPMSRGETRRVGYFFIGGEEAVNYFSSAEKFYIWEGRIVGQARIVSSEDSRNAT
jgi:hypothetical protein